MVDSVILSTRNGYGWSAGETAVEGATQVVELSSRNGLGFSASKRSGYLATVARGTLIAAFGDSTVRGVSTGGGGGQFANAWTEKLAARLRSRFINASGRNMFGVGSGSWASLLSMDSRVTSTGAFTQTASLVPGGNAFGINSPASAGSATVQLGLCDTVNIYWVNNTAGRIMDYATDDGEAGQLITSGVYQIEKTTIAVPRGERSITFTQNTAHRPTNGNAT